MNKISGIENGQNIISKTTHMTDSEHFERETGNLILANFAHRNLLKNVTPNYVKKTFA